MLSLLSADNLILLTGFLPTNCINFVKINSIQKYLYFTNEISVSTFVRHNIILIFGRSQTINNVTRANRYVSVRSNLVA